MPLKDGGGGKPQPYDEKTGKYNTSGNSRDYDKEIAELKEKSKGKVISMQVKAKDIQFAGDDIREWGYFPQENDFESGLKRGLNLK